MENKHTVFLTGATGLVGSYLLKMLLEGGYKVYALSRGKDGKTPQERIATIINFWDKHVLKKSAKNLVVVEGDITNRNWDLNIKQDFLEGHVEEIFHCAAIVKFNWPLGEICRVNVEGTRNILNFAKECRNLKKMNHISTAYVCGNYESKFSEYDLNVGQGFDTTYEQSKFEAEQLVNDYRKQGLWVDVFRPPLVVGDAITGKTFHFQGFYQMLHLWRLEIFDVFPGRELAINIVTVDQLIKAILTLAFSISLKNQNYHPFSSEKLALGKALSAMSKLIKFKKPKLVSFNEFGNCNITPSQKRIIKNNISFFNPKVCLDANFTGDCLKHHGFIFPKIDDSILRKLVNYWHKNHSKSEKILH